MIFAKWEELNYSMKRGLYVLIVLLQSLNVFSQFPGCPDVDAGIDQTLSCPGICTTLTAEPIVSGLTTSYTVAPVDYDPPISYNAPGGTPISVNTDDVWSPVVQLPFNFCYYGQTFTSCRVGSNGAIRLGPSPGANYHPWEFNAMVPSPSLVEAGNIFGIYHDIDPAVPVAGGGQVRWYLLGTAPCRIFVVSFYEMAHFSCNNLRSTHMMVLYETTNVIDVYVEKKQTCNNWNGGRAVIGIQNFNGTQGLAAPNRNTGPWTVSTPEAWRFSPAGTPNYTVSWFQGSQLISNNLSVQVCPNTTTSYTASVTYTPCAGGQPVTVTDDITVFVNQGITPSFTGINTNYCQGAIIPNLPNNSNNGISGIWSPAINNQQTTTYTFTPNPNQCASPIEITMNINPIVTPTFTFPLSYCSGQNIPPLPNISQNGISGVWSPALNNQTTTNYTFTPNPNQCAAPTNVTIEIDNIETPLFEIESEICQGETTVPLPPISINGINGVWSPPFNNQQSTTYTFTPSAGSCATGSVDWTIDVVQNIVPEFASVGPFCMNSSIAPLPTTSENEINGFWTPAINNQISTTYTFTALDSGCFVQTQMFIEIIPTVESFNVINYCQNELPYFWNGLALNQSGIYEAQFISSVGCDSIAKIEFVVVPNVESMTVLQICENEVPYLWNGLTISTTGSYNTVLTSSLGCDSIAYLSLTIRPIPQFDFMADIDSGCGSVEVNFSIQSETPFVESKWVFSDGSFSNQLGGIQKLFGATGCHDVTLTLTNLFACSNTITKSDFICVFPNPVPDFIVNPTVLDEFNQTANFINLSTNADRYFWTFGHNNAFSNVANPSYTYPDLPAQYPVWLIAENDFGCIDSTIRYIDVIIAPVYYIPNTFTPDGDQFNNTFQPVFSSGFDPFNYQLLIFDRWGEVLFESRNANVGWDGTYGGQLMQDGVYIYQVVFRDLYSDKRYEVKGHVSLIR